MKHELLYVVNFEGHRIRFWPDLERFMEELSTVFPSEKEQIQRFYRAMYTMYRHVMVENPTYTTADETNVKAALRSIFKHPISYARFLGSLNKSAKQLLESYFYESCYFPFFDKLTSTYCYATVEEAPAVMAAVMFVDNHVGGSYYPAGSTLFLPGKLEKVIEENGGEMFYNQVVETILFVDHHPIGVRLSNGIELLAEQIVYSGTVWNLYEKLLPPQWSSPAERTWAEKLVPTYPSVVLYAVVDRKVIPDGTAALELLVGNPEQLDESEVTAYLLSLDDQTLCAEDEHTVMAIGPTFEDWSKLSAAEYRTKKQVEQERLIAVLERRFPGFSQAIRSAEVATPRTIERYTLKNKRAVAGPKQMIGQHLFHRLHTRSPWKNLVYCGESTVMGTGTPTVTVSGLTAANVLLKQRGLKPFEYDPRRPEYVRILPKPFTNEMLFAELEPEERDIRRAAMRCRYCEHPSCTLRESTDVRGIMRRVAVGNFMGAKKVGKRIQWMMPL